MRKNDSASTPKPSSYTLPLPGKLIQSIRAMQSVMEAGLTVNINRQQEPTFRYLGRFFPVSYVVEDEHSIKAKNVSISHKKPVVRIGSSQRPLLFPHSIINECKSLWPNSRKDELLFVGLITRKRKKVLLERHKEIGRAGQRIIIKNSRRGREFPQKAWDPSYYRLLSSVKFVLCPNGDFVWTYRFFEAILCGAIPIVEENCDLYKGFYFYTMEDKDYHWTSQIAEKNYRQAVKLLTLDNKTIKSAIEINTRYSSQSLVKKVARLFNKT